MHSILQRQIRKYLGVKDSHELTPDVKEFVAAIDSTYTHFDEDRKLLERSIEISSTELQQINEQLKQENEALRNSKAENKELEQMNKFMIGRELRMAELKETIAQLQKKCEDLEKKSAQTS